MRAPASLLRDVGNFATVGVERRRLTTERARPLVTDLEEVTIRELLSSTCLDLGIELGIYTYDAYIVEAARSSGFPLLALNGPIRTNAKKFPPFSLTTPIELRYGRLRSDRLANSIE